MIEIEVFLGLINVVIGLLIIYFRKSISKSHLITFPQGFGGKSMQENFGESKGIKAVIIIGLIFLISGSIIAVAGILNIILFS